MIGINNKKVIKFICIMMISLFMINFAYLAITNIFSNTNSIEKNNEFKYAYAFFKEDKQIADNFKLIDYVPGETTEMYIMVNFVNYKNAKNQDVSFSKEDIARIEQNFNDNTPNNEFFSMHEYFYAQSRGKLNVWALFMEHTTSHPESFFKFPVTTNQDLQMDYKNEAQIFKDALSEKKNKKPFQFNGKTISEFVCRINYFAGNATDYNSSFWPKNWLSKDGQNGLILYTQMLQGEVYQRYVGVICHELTHLMGIDDYYVDPNLLKSLNKKFFPVGVWDIMANTDRDHPQTMSPYFRKEVGWFSESQYYDNKNTDIEYISSSGNYTIHNSESQEGIIAYTFGVRNNNETEYFMVEFKHKDRSLIEDYYTYDSRLLIYRINTKINAGDFESLTPEKCHVYVFRNGDLQTEGNPNAGIRDKFGSKDISTSFGATSGRENLITYSDTTNSQIVISNLVINNFDRTATFDISFPKDLFCISGVITENDIPMPNAKIFVNGNLTSQTTDANGYYFISNLNKDDIVSFKNSKDEIIENTFTITENNKKANINVISKCDLEMNVLIDGIPLKDVDFYIGNTKVGTTALNGKALLEKIPLKSEIKISKHNYDFDPTVIKFTDIENTKFNITAFVAKRDLNFAIKINNLPLQDVNILVNGKSNATTDANGFAQLKNIEIGSVITFEMVDITFEPTQITFETTDITEFEVVAKYDKLLEEYALALLISDYDTNATIIENLNILKNNNKLTNSDLVYKYGAFYFNSVSGDTITIEKEGYKPFVLELQSSNLNKQNQLQIRKFCNHTFNLKDTHNNLVKDCKVYQNGNLIGQTDESGKFAFDKFVSGDSIEFVHEFYDIKSLAFDSLNLIDNIELISKEIKIKIYMNDFNNNKILFNDVVIKIDNEQIEYIANETYLEFNARLLDEIIISKDKYEFSKVVIEQNLELHDYTTKVLKYLEFEGQIKYEDGELLNLVYKIYDGETIIGYTDYNGKFKLTNVLEGSKLVFKSLGFESKEIMALNSSSDLKIPVKQTNNSNNIALYCMGGFFGFLLIFGLIDSIKSSGRVKAQKGAINQNKRKK